MQEQFDRITAFEKASADRGSAGHRVIFRSKSQEHGFNFPFQVGTHGDDPQVAEQHEVELQAGDLVVLGTDGVFDNVYDFQVLQMVDRLSATSQLSPTLLAESLSRTAFEQSQDLEFLSPFCNSKYHQLGKPCVGGKKDDITVSLGRVGVGMD